MKLDQIQTLKRLKGFVSMYDLNQLCVVPWTRGTGCSLASLMSRSDVADVQLMVSHACKLPLTAADAVFQLSRLFDTGDCVWD